MILELRLFVCIQRNEDDTAARLLIWQTQFTAPRKMRTALNLACDKRQQQPPKHGGVGHQHHFGKCSNPSPRSLCTNADGYVVRRTVDRPHFRRNESETPLSVCTQSSAAALRRQPLLEDRNEMEHGMRSIPKLSHVLHGTRFFDS